jgi:radical SAM superfamily enzyme YgiQ (UPF0313 family)
MSDKNYMKEVAVESHLTKEEVEIMMEKAPEVTTIWETLRNRKSAQPLNYLLVMPRLVQKIGDGYSFPLGISYVSASMKKAGFNVFTLNLNHHEGKVPDIIRKAIEEHDIQVVATGGLSFQYPSIKEIVETAKHADSSIITIVGGGIVTSDPVPALDAMEYVDYGINKEAEVTICELCDYLENGKAAVQPNPADIQGIIYKDTNPLRMFGDGGYLVTPNRKELRDLDSLPWPDYAGFDLDQYIEESPSVSGINRKNTVFMISSRSCPYDCTFCFHTTGKVYRQRSLDDFFSELDHMIEEYKIDYICIADELFSVNWRRVIEFCERIKPYNVKWWAQFRCDHIAKHPELLELLKDAGCETMSFGLESADNEVLKSMEKKTSVEIYDKALKLVYDSGISLEGAFIFGDPAETVESAQRTLKWWRENIQYKVNLNLITVYPGTPLYFDAFDKGIIKDKVQFLRDGCPQIKMCDMTDEEYGTLIREILEAPMTLPQGLATVEVKYVDYKRGRMGVAGTCTQCRTRNQWDNLKLLSSSFMGCEKCGQRYNVVQPPELIENIDRNLTKLLNKYGKIGIWGINYHVTNLIRKSKVLLNNDDNIFFIDSSKSKQLMDLFGKPVHSPDIIDAEQLKAVVIPIPVYYNEIEMRAFSFYDSVEQTIDVMKLTDPEYILPFLSNRPAWALVLDHTATELRDRTNQSTLIEF